MDLAKYIEATFAGSTPGQQAAQLCMVTPKDLKEAKAAARELGIVEIDLPPMMLAMAVKANRLAKAIGCETKEAWLLLQKEREGLMPYVHQKRPLAAEAKEGEPAATVFLVRETDAQQLDGQVAGAQPDSLELIEDFTEPAR